MSGDRSRAAVIAGRPPGPDFFATASDWQPLGRRGAAIDLPGLSIGFAGMDENWHADFIESYAPYGRDVATGSGALTLTFSASRGGPEQYIAPPLAGVETINPVWVEVEGDPAAGGHCRVRSCTYGLAATFSSAGGSGLAVFSRGLFDPRERAVENLVRVATAWLAIMRGGLLMHSASIVKDGRAYLFFGQSGSGKSTLAALSRRGKVASDDLTLMLPGDSGTIEIVGAPFRGTYTGGPAVTGRYPVAAAFRLKKAAPSEPPAVEPLKPGMAMAEAIANLPFVVDQLHLRPDLFARAERVLSSFPIRLLRFGRKDDSYWEAIAAAHL